MIIDPQNNYVINPHKTRNEELSLIKGELDDEQARVTLAKFLRANLGFTCQMISGVKLFKYQEIILNGLFLSNYSMMVLSRGGAKSFLASVFCYLYCIFNPGTKIVIAGPTYRTARFIFSKLEEIVKSKEAILLEQCMPLQHMSKKNDMHEWEVNGGKIVAIPLAGEKIRGFRANVLIVDEANWVDKEIIEKVLMPFLVSPQNLKEIIERKEIEDQLIKDGRMKEADRTPNISDIKMILLSSAGYTFEHLYSLYNSWLSKITGNEESAQGIKYFIAQMAWDALPAESMDKTVIEEASKGGNLSTTFKMEYGAQFCDGSDSFFNSKKMEECTLKVGEEPNTLMEGRPDKKYILSIDPNMSEAPNADYFAMSVLELDEEKEDATLVHGYQGLLDFNNHIKYLTYILNNFNIVLIIGDSMGLDTLISAANSSELFKRYGHNLKYLEFSSCEEGKDYELELISAKSQYNQIDGRIVIRQVYGVGDFIRKANEYLQACINSNKIWFASNTVSNEFAFNAIMNMQLPEDTIRSIKAFSDKKGFSTLDFIDLQDQIIKETKKQCSLIEFTSTARGNYNYDLPTHLRRSQSDNKQRRDNYSTLVLGAWGMRQYFAIRRHESKKHVSLFVPKILR